MTKITENTVCVPDEIVVFSRKDSFLEVNVFVKLLIVLKPVVQKRKSNIFYQNNFTTNNLLIIINIHKNPEHRM